MPSIRDATEDDLGALLEMGRRFADACGLERIAQFDPVSMTATFKHLINDENGILLIGDGCAAGGLVYPAYWNASHMTGQEFFWWADPENRGEAGPAMLDALETAAKERGAKSWTMIALDNLRPDATGRLYERRGYRPTEHSYVRVF